MLTVQWLCFSEQQHPQSMLHVPWLSTRQVHL